MAADSSPSGGGGGVGLTEVSRRMICGGVAGMVAKTVTNPLERLKILSQTGEHAGTTTYWSIYKTILKQEGVLGLWAGNGANLLRVFPSKAVVFSTNDFYRNQIRRLTGESSKLSVWSSFLAGGLAGMSATAATYPLDLTRGRIAGKCSQLDTKAYRGVMSTILVTLKDEGVAGLYKGITPTILGSMPYVGIQFATVGFLEKQFPKDDDKPSPLRKTLFGGVGGVSAGLVTYPNDTLRHLLQLQGSRGTVVVYNGYIDCIRQTVGTHGIARLYRGAGVNIFRMAPNTAVSFGTYEFLKQLTAPLERSPLQHDSDRQAPNLTPKLLDK